MHYITVKDQHGNYYEIPIGNDAAQQDIRALLSFAAAFIGLSVEVLKFVSLGEI